LRRGIGLQREVLTGAEESHLLGARGIVVRNEHRTVESAGARGGERQTELTTGASGQRCGG